MGRTVSRHVNPHPRNPHAEDAWEQPSAGPHGKTRTAERQEANREVRDETEEALIEMGFDPDEVLRY